MCVYDAAARSADSLQFRFVFFFCSAYQLMQVDEHDLSTVLNRDTFTQLVEFRQCPLEGRSLVNKQPLAPGDIVLVERPQLQYLLNPTCRSSISPHYSKKLWQSLQDVLDPYDDEFIPGIPAAMLAYLNLKHPDDDYDFFYYPDFAHPTVDLVRQVCDQVTATLPEFAKVDADSMSRFILKIYGNAHTVSFHHDRGKTTHTRRRRRREYYRSKWGESYSFPDDISRQRSMICLMSWGSKFAHSCAPNLFLQYEPKDNCMVFRAVRHLEPGTVLSFSYLPEDDMSLGGLVCGTTAMRRAKLDKFKFFHCQCTRCVKEEQENDVVSKQIQATVLKLAAVAHGLQEDPEAVSMIEPYLTEELGENNVPKDHWIYGMAQSALAAYHLRIFPTMFGKGLAERLGLVDKGLEEAEAYIQYLHQHIWPDNPMAAFFAGWRVLELVLPRDHALVTLVKEHWIPLVHQVFEKRRSPVIDDMIKRIGN